MRKVPFILVTGFLGSGKTSLLMDLVGRYSDQMRIAVVQNEFAPGHVDGATLRKSGKTFELLEINNGSVFCACLLGDFITRLEPFIEQHRPDLILLEATGLADPVSLGQVLQAPGLSDRIYLAGSWCLVDAVNFHRIVQAVTRSKQQIRIADIVWINKTDRVRDTVEIRNQILEINPFARILETTYGQTDQLNLEESIYTTTNLENLPVGHGFPVPEAEGRPALTSCVVRSTRFFDPDRVRDFVLEQTQRLYRIKGYIRIDERDTLAIQTVFSDISFKIIAGYSGPGELIAIGPDFNIREFSKMLLALQKNENKTD